MKSLFAILFFTLITSAFGRSPAVEPIRGISIEEYREVDPSKDPGYNWNKAPVDTSLITTRVPAEAKMIQKTRNQQTAWPTYVFLAGLITLPFVLWYSVMKGLEQAETTEGLSANSYDPTPDNTVNLATERDKRDEKKDDDQISKAS